MLRKTISFTKKFQIKFFIKHEKNHQAFKAVSRNRLFKNI